MKILKFPNEFLREKIPNFDFLNPDLDPVNLEKELLEIMFLNNGIGLAANQVGIKCRVFVMGHRDNPQLGQAFFNPEIVANTEDLTELEEGCLSFPGIFVKIKRPKKILARWQNSKGEWQEGAFEGYDCKCFLHEFDHLEGIVFKDRTSQLKWSMAVKEKNKRNINVTTK